MEIPKPISDWVRNFTESHNKRVLDGTSRDRVIPVNLEQDLKGLETVLNTRRFKQIASRLKSTYERTVLGREFVHGFVLFGSFANFIFKQDSDIDILILVNEPEIQVGNRFEVQNAHIVTKSFDLKSIKDLNSLMSEVAIVVFILSGIPFGEEMIDLQKCLLDFLEKLPPDDLKIVWPTVYEMIRQTQNASPVNTNLSEKYTLIKPKLTLQEYKDEWEKKINWSRRFCQENQIQF